MTKALELPEKWDEELAHYVGWLVGDGCVTEAAAVTVYGSVEEQETLLGRHTDLMERITGHRGKPSVQANGTQQLRVTRDGVLAFLVDSA
jgi:ribonucleoside-diphosphate reductase alpha chain